MRFARLIAGLLLVLALASLTLAQPSAPPWAATAEGVEHTSFRRPAPAGGEWNINALRIDMTKARLDVIRANDAAIGLERVSAMAARTSALAAINGGYFRTSGAFLGESTGTLQIDRVLWSEPDRGRSAVGIVRERHGARLIFGHVAWTASLEAGRARLTVDGVNRARGSDELVVFTPQFGPATITDDSGVEAIVRGGRVTEVREAKGATPIPRDGFVVSARGRAREWVLRQLRPRTRTRVQTELRPVDPEGNSWTAAEDILGAGPRLVTNGAVDVTDAREKMVPTFATETHPRTAIASLADGRVLLLTADGRHPPERVGLALDDLATLLIELGARDAINLDGGGSTTMVVKGAIVNVPSDATGERPVSDAIVVRPLSNRP